MNEKAKEAILSIFVCVVTILLGFTFIDKYPNRAETIGLTTMALVFMLAMPFFDWVTDELSK